MRTSLVLVVALITGVVSACSDSGAPSFELTVITVTPDVTPALPTEEAFLDEYEPEVGDCVGFDPDGEVIEQRCMDAHEGEISAVVPYVDDSGDAFPGEAALREFAHQACLKQFEGYVGVDFAHSGLDGEYLWPKADAWEAGLRVVWCLVRGLGGEPLTGVVRDSGGLKKPGLVLAADLKTGMCISSQGDIWPFYVALPCSDPHDAEVFAVLTHPAAADEPFPGDDAVHEFGDGCFAFFEDYVGIRYEDSYLDVGSEIPAEDFWSGGQRAFACYLLNPEGKIEGSMLRTGNSTALYPIEPGGHLYTLDDLTLVLLDAAEAPHGTELGTDNTVLRDGLADTLGRQKGMPLAIRVVTFATPELVSLGPDDAEARSIFIQAQLFTSSGAASAYLSSFAEEGGALAGFAFGDESVAIASTRAMAAALDPGITAGWRIDNLLFQINADGAADLDLVKALAETITSRAIVVAGV